MTDKVVGAIDASTESNDEFLRLEQLAGVSPSPEEDLKQRPGQAEIAAASAKTEQLADEPAARAEDLFQRTDALAGEDARALIREMVSSIPAVRKWLGNYQFPAGTTFHPLANRRSAHPAAFAGSQPGYMANLARTPRRGSTALNSQISLLRQQLKSASYSTGGQDPHKLFSLYDRDNSGSLDMKEFGNAIRKGGRVTTHQMSDADLAQLFQAADTDGCDCSLLADQYPSILPACS